MTANVYWLPSKYDVSSGGGALRLKLRSVIIFSQCGNRYAKLNA